MYLPTIKPSIRNKLEDDPHNQSLNKEQNEQENTNKNTIIKLPWKIQLLKKDIQDRTLKANRNLSVISRNLRNLKVLKSPHTRHIDQKRESLPIEVNKLSKAHKLEQSQQINIRISDNGLKYVNNSENSSENSKSKQKLATRDKSGARENSFKDYAESKFSNINAKSFKFINKSTESLKAKLRYSTESLIQNQNKLNNSILNIRNLASKDTTIMVRRIYFYLDGV